MKPILHQAIRIQLKPSLPMLGLLSCISIICSWILLALPIALAIKLATIMLVIASSLYFILRDALLLLPWSWQVLEVDGKGQLSLSNRRGQSLQPVLVANDTFIHPILIMINFKHELIGFALPPVIIFANQANTDEARRLRVWLRWGIKAEKN